MERELRNFWLNGWGYVEGQLVYVPLWDPAPEKLNAGYVSMMLANALSIAARLLPKGELAERAMSMAKGYAGKVSNGLAADWDEDICPRYEHPVPHFGGPHFAEFVGQQSPAVQQELLGFAIERIGRQVKENDVTEIGREIALGAREDVFTADLTGLRLSAEQRNKINSAVQDAVVHALTQMNFEDAVPRLEKRKRPYGIHYAPKVHI